jgi:glucose/arabinose dehydrogenase
MRCRLIAAAIATALACAVSAQGQALDDPSLRLELVASGLSLPTSMAFVAPDDILVLDKEGAVRRVQNGVLLPAPVRTLVVNSEYERGALGIAVDTASPPHVFILYTEADSPGGTPLGNRVYRFDWNPGAGTLDSPSFVLDLPVLPGANHDGGVIMLGPPNEVPGVGDGSLLYVVIGDLNRQGQLQNFPSGLPPDDSSVILRVRQDGTPAPGNPFTPYCSVHTATTCAGDSDCPGGETCTTKVARYYAYGVRNSFGLALDPVTGALWDTENGPTEYDEVNRVLPGMNSGWYWLQGPAARSPYGVGDLFHMPGAGITYHDPEFSWLVPIAPTALVFPFHSALGPAYDDKVILGDVVQRQLYALPLNGARTGFDTSGLPGLADLVADSPAERDAVRIGTGMAVTDLEIGPDGALYVVKIVPGAIYRIRADTQVPLLPGWAVGAIALLLVGGAVVANLFGWTRGVATR